MFLSVATTHRPAIDLGFLLHKHPDRLHETELTFGRAWLFYPEATEERCEATLLMDVDPVRLVRRIQRLFPGMAVGAIRHPDHRFEWTRAEFEAWARRIEAAYGYTAAFSGIGRDDQALGSPTQMAVFTR